MSAKSNYLTIKQAGQHETIIKKSRFIASFTRVYTVKEAQQFIAQTKQRYRDATHNTFAYTIGLGDEQVKVSDNGEPAGTAGVPELKALQLMQLKNVAVVVTRYFGGIKLGAGGLIRAYSNAVSEGAEALGIVKRILQQSFTLTLPYTALGKVSNYLAEHELPITDRQFGTTVTLTFLLEPTAQLLQQTQSDLNNLLAATVTLTKGQTLYREIAWKKRAK